MPKAMEPEFHISRAATASIWAGPARQISRGPAEVVPATVDPSPVEILPAGRHGHRCIVQHRSLAIADRCKRRYFLGRETARFVQDRIDHILRRSPNVPAASAAPRPATCFNVKAISPTGARYIAFLLRSGCGCQAPAAGSRPLPSCLPPSYVNVNQKRCSVADTHFNATSDLETIDAGRPQSVIESYRCSKSLTMILQDAALVPRSSVVVQRKHFPVPAPHLPRLRRLLPWPRPRCAYASDFSQPWLKSGPRAGRRRL